MEFYMKDEYIKTFYNEICQNLGDNYKIILEPGRSLNEEWIEYDQVKWVMEDVIENLVNSLKNNKTLTFEEKILMVYNRICLEYVYDANVLFFFRKDTSDPENVKYIAVDWYGRIVDEEWLSNRKKHNRRICYEFARIYAKAINELIEEDEKYKGKLEACMVGDKDNLHYVVGLTGEKYSAILDLDDFNSIKDLTRLKLGLTLKGINIFRDESHILQKAIDKFNEDRPVELPVIEKARKMYKSNEIDIIKYFKCALEALRDYNIDPQGIFEYMRFLVEQEEIEVEKLWKEVKAQPEKRYERCFVFENEGKTYLIDTVMKVLITVNKEELKRDFVSNPVEKEYPYYGG